MFGWNVRIDGHKNTLEHDTILQFNNNLFTNEGFEEWEQKLREDREGVEHKYEEIKKKSDHHKDEYNWSGIHEHQSPTIPVREREKLEKNRGYTV